eukprot:31058-Pelagococcus_subviridis.AAC.20
MPAYHPIGTPAAVIAAQARGGDEGSPRVRFVARARRRARAGSIPAASRRRGGRPRKKSESVDASRRTDGRTRGGEARRAVDDRVLWRVLNDPHLSCLPFPCVFSDDDDDRARSSRVRSVARVSAMSFSAASDVRARGLGDGRASRCARPRADRAPSLRPRSNLALMRRRADFARSIRTFITHRSVSTLDRFPFQF